MVMAFLVGDSWGRGRLYLQRWVAPVDGGGVVMGNGQRSRGRHGRLGRLVFELFPVRIVGRGGV